MPSTKAKVLLVDDKEENLLVLKVALEELKQCELVTCNSGAEALNYLSQNEVAAIALDVQMPQMDGFETALRIRSLPGAKSTPILFVTALNPEDEYLNKAYDLDAVDFLTKPLNIKAIQTKIKFFVDLYLKTKALDKKNIEFQKTAESEKAVLLETSLDAVVGANEENLITYWNQHAEQVFGWHKDEVLGQDLTMLIVPERLREAHRNGVKRFLATGVARIQNRRIEIPALRKTGEEFPIELTVTTINRGNGVIFYSFIRDISESVRAKEAIQRRLAAEQDYIHLFESSPIPTWIYDAETLRFLKVNQVAIERYGYSAEEFRQMTVRQIRPQEELPKFEKHMEKVKESKGIVQHKEHFAHIKKNGERILVEISSCPLILNDRECFVVVAHDVTAKVEALNEAKKLNRLKDEFLATLSHELRTPMNVIQGHAEILKSELGNPSQEIRQSVEAILRNASVQTEIITDLLDVSSIVTGKIAFHPILVSPLKLISEVVQGLKPYASEKSVEVKLESSDCQRSAYGDPTRLRQIFWNLISNAIKFSPKGGTVKVRFNTRDNQWSVDVEDSGIGIDPEFLPFVFDRFRQQDASSSRKFGGLGLGLSIARNLTELHGGSIAVYSEGPNRGAKFSVSLPLANQSIIESPQEQKASAQSYDLTGLKILLVEDSSDNRALVKRILARAGAEVIDAEGPEKARQHLAKHTFDIIVSDIGMPDEDGLQFISKLRDSKPKTYVPAIALTAYVRDEERASAIKAGFNAHVAKPVSAIELTKTIFELVPPKGQL